MRGPVCIILLAALLLLPGSAESRPASHSTQVRVALFEGNPLSGGKVLRVAPLDTVAGSVERRALYAALHIGPRRFLFAVARPAGAGTPLGLMVVSLRDGNRTLFETVRLLEAALAGHVDLVVLTLGRPEAGVVTAIVPLPAGTEPGAVSTEGASHSLVLRKGQETTTAVGPERPGPTMVRDGSSEEERCRFCQGGGTQ